jgi:hypothetical protein
MCLHIFHTIFSRARDVKDSFLFSSFHMQRIFSTATTESTHGKFESLLEQECFTKFVSSEPETRWLKLCSGRKRKTYFPLFLIYTWWLCFGAYMLVNLICVFIGFCLVWLLFPSGNQGCLRKKEAFYNHCCKNK